MWPIRVSTLFQSRYIAQLISVEAKERSGGFGSSDDKFSGNWRRDAPLPDTPSHNRDGGSRRRYEGLSGGAEAARDSVPDNNVNWRSSRPARAPEPDVPAVRRRGSGFSTPHEGDTSPADAEEKWSIGGKFKPSGPPPEGQSGGRFGQPRVGRGDMGPPPVPSAADEGVWRKPRPGLPGRNSTSRWFLLELSSCPCIHVVFSY